MAMITNLNTSTSPRDHLSNAVRALITVLNELQWCDDFQADNATDATIEAAFGVAAGQGAALRTLITNANSTAKGAATKAIVKQFVP